jgi:hypothetical protein
VAPGHPGRLLAGWWSAPWSALAQWVGPNLLGLDIVIQPTGRGDTAYRYSLALSSDSMRAFIEPRYITRRTAQQRARKRSPPVIVCMI